MKDKNSTKQISGRLEKKFAKKTGGKTTIGSGCFYFDTSDIKYENYLIEHKYTQKNTYTVTSKVLQKNEQEAYSQLKTPILVVQFIDEYENLLATFLIYRSKEVISKKTAKGYKIDITQNQEFPVYVNLDGNNYKIEKVDIIDESIFKNI